MPDERPKLKVDACLPLRMSHVAPGAVDRRRKAVLAGPQRQTRTTTGLSAFDRKDVLSQLCARIEALESKIDGLIALVVHEQQREAQEHAVSLELSGEGLRFRWPEALRPGQVLELELTLILFPPLDVRFLVQVEACEEEQEDSGAEQRHHMVSARFLAISEDCRDEIHRYMLTSQRQQRRAERGESASP
jgi:hypothetical protein